MMTILETGNVGIGTSNPTSLFEVNNYISISDYNYKRSSLEPSTNASSYGLYFINLNLIDYNIDSSILTYITNQIDGDSFIINKTGIYSINTILSSSVSTVIFWIDKNSLATASNTDVNGINLIAISTRGSNYYEHTLSYMGLLEKNDVIRLKANPKFTSTTSSLTIDFIMSMN